MPLAKTAARLLKMSDHDLQVEVDKLKNGIVTDKVEFILDLNSKKKQAC